MLGGIDEVEVEAELRDPEQGGEEMAAAVHAQGGAAHRRPGEHRRGSDDEAVGHRPGRRDGAELVLDDDPGRAPDQGNEEEGNKDLRVAKATGGLAHSALIAAARAATCSGSESQAVTSRASPGPQS